MLAVIVSQRYCYLSWGHLEVLLGFSRGRPEWQTPCVTCSGLAWWFIVPHVTTSVAYCWDTLGRLILPFSFSGEHISAVKRPNKYVSERSKAWPLSGTREGSVGIRHTRKYVSLASAGCWLLLVNLTFQTKAGYPKFYVKLSQSVAQLFFLFITPRPNPTDWWAGFGPQTIGL